MKSVYLLLLSFTLCSYAQAQNTFEKIIDTLGSATAVCIQETFDNGYVFCGVSTFNNNDVVIVKLDSIGTIEWAKLYSGPGMEGATSIEQTPDSGYMVNAAYDVGLNSKVWLMRLDTNGDTLWTQTYASGAGSNEANHGNSMASISYAVYGLTGYFDPPSPNPIAPFLIVTDSNGSVLANKVYDFSLYGSTGQAICKSYDNTGFAITGQHGVSYTSADINLIRTNIVGDTLWTRTYDFTYAEQAFAITATADSGFITAGITWNNAPFVYNIYLIKTDAAGDTIWTKMYYSNEEQGPTSIQQTTDGGYILLGNAKNGTSNADVYLIKTNSVGEILWTRFFGGPANDVGKFVRQTYDGGYIISGGGGVFGNAGAYIIKTDSLGNVSPGTGIAEVNNPIFFNVYPNPASGIINVQVKGIPLQGAVLKIYHTLGQTIFYHDFKEDATILIDLSSVTDGLYAVTLSIDNTFHSKQLIIQK